MDELSAVVYHPKIYSICVYFKIHYCSRSINFTSAYGNMIIVLPLYGRMNAVPVCVTGYQEVYFCFI